ncbi:MAG: thioester reductase domain-containing protein, partial [Acidobacteriota bacterium]
MLGRDPGRDTAGSGGAAPLDRVSLLHPVLFALEHALGRLWMSFGIEPAAFLGYSLGEYVAACLAGVLELEDALAVVAERARLVEEAAGGGPAGAMLAIPEGEETLRTRLGPDLSVAAVNGPAMTVVAGPAEAVAELEQRLVSAGVAGRRLPARHAFHTPALEPCAAPLAETLARVDLRPPRVPVVSNVSGTWLADAEATDPGYWARHLVSPVRFGAGLSTLLGARHRAFVEIGPGQGLGSLVVQQSEAESAGGPVVVPSLPAAFDGRDDVELLLRSLSRLWLAGVTPGDGLWAGEARRRVHLPTYPFERRRFWIDPPARTGDDPDAAPATPPAGEDRGAARIASVHDRPRVGTPYAEPATELERRVAEAWGEVLGIRRPGAHDDFFELGGNSLIVPQVLLRVRQSLALDHDLPVQALLQSPTVSSFARTLERMADEGPGAVPGSEAVDLWAESELEPEVRPAGETALPLRPERPTAVLLTGGTGFFGAFLLERLLQATSGRVYCLVRAEDREAGRARLEQALRGYGLWYPELAERIEPVPGDLTRPGLGLDPTVRDELATTVEAVYHAGAWVNFTYPYRTLAPANVDGTREALRFAATGAPKPFHFVSSIAVFAPGSLGPGGIAYEDSPLEATEGLFSGYAETKWVAERLVAEAGRRGLPVTVHRPGVIGGSARTGAGNPRDLVWNLLKGCIQLGLVPRGIGLADVAPADYVAGALVHASLRPESAGKAFHYPNPHPTPWDDVFAAVAKLGYRLR